MSNIEIRTGYTPVNYIVRTEDGDRQRIIQALTSADAALLWADLEWQAMGRPDPIDCIVVSDDGEWRISMEISQRPVFRLMEQEEVTP
jgi:hypothetical protein